MSHQKKQRTRIEDLSADGNELFELSEQMMMMVGGGYGGEVTEPDDSEIETQVRRPCSNQPGGYDYCTYSDDEAAPIFDPNEL